MTIRRMTLEDLDQSQQLASYAYGITSPEWAETDSKLFEITHNQTYCMEVEGTIAASVRNIPFEQNIHDNWKDMGGISMVASLPEHRRKGYVRDLMKRILNDAYEAGHATSTLYPFKSSFYTRMGYAKMLPSLSLNVNPAQFRIWRNPPGYSVVRGDYAEVGKDWQEVHARYVESVHGGVRRSATRWREFELSLKSTLAIIYGPDGTPQGAIVYKTKGYGDFSGEENRGLMRIRELLYLNGEARSAMFSFIHLHQDQIVDVKMPVGPHIRDYSHWVTDANVLDMKAHILHMARIVNLEEAFRNYPVRGEGNLALKVSDPIIAENDRTYRFEWEGGNIAVEETEKTPDGEISVEGLSALYYGLLSPKELIELDYLVGEECSPLEGLFTRNIPYLTEPF